jgi:hypothetical protein
MEDGYIGSEISVILDLDPTLLRWNEFLDPAVSDVNVCNQGDLHADGRSFSDDDLILEIQEHHPAEMTLIADDEVVIVLFGIVDDQRGMHLDFISDDGSVFSKHRDDPCRGRHEQEDVDAFDSQADVSQRNDP